MKRIVFLVTMFLLFSITQGFCETVVCNSGGTLSGIGGDGFPYSETFTGYGELVISINPANSNLRLLTLNGNAWPAVGWSVTADSWELTCNAGCLTIDSDLGIPVPCAQIGSVQYGFDLDYYVNPNDPFGHYWKLDLSSLTVK